MISASRYLIRFPPNDTEATIDSCAVERTYAGATVVAAQAGSLEHKSLSGIRKFAAASHTAFVVYHVGIRQDALRAMFDLVNKHRDLPTLCLLLGNLLAATKQRSTAKKCWSLAIQRDRPRGAMAAVVNAAFTTIDETRFDLGQQ